MEGQQDTSTANAIVNLPRVTIKYCTQCKWLLRAAYFAQELLSTFSTQIGEVALQPMTGGIFTVTVVHATTDTAAVRETLLWDRKAEGGFPETKQLKSLLRNIIDPTRDLGHIDRSLNKVKDKTSESAASTSTSTSAAAAASTTEVTSTASDYTAGGVVGSAHQHTSQEGVDTDQGQGDCEDCV